MVHIYFSVLPTNWWRCNGRSNIFNHSRNLYEGLWTYCTTALHPPKVWGQFVDGVYSILTRMHLENFFHYIDNLHQNINFTMEEESNRQLAFLDTLLKRNNGKICILVYRNPAHTDQYIHYSSHHVCLSQNNKRKPQISKRKRSEWVVPNAEIICIEFHQLA